MPTNNPQKEGQKGFKAAIERTTSALKGIYDAGISTFMRGGRTSSIEKPDKESNSSPPTSPNGSQSSPLSKSLNVKIFEETETLVARKENEVIQFPADSAAPILPTYKDITNIKHSKQHSDATTKLAENLAKEKFEEFVQDIQEINAQPNSGESKPKR